MSTSKPLKAKHLKRLQQWQAVVLTACYISITRFFLFLLPTFPIAQAIHRHHPKHALQSDLFWKDGALGLAQWLRSLDGQLSNLFIKSVLLLILADLLMAPIATLILRRWLFSFEHPENHYAILGRYFRIIFLQLLRRFVQIILSIPLLAVLGIIILSSALSQDQLLLRGLALSLLGLLIFLLFLVGIIADKAWTKLLDGLDIKSFDALIDASTEIGKHFGYFLWLASFFALPQLLLFAISIWLPPNPIWLSISLRAVLSLTQSCYGVIWLLKIRSSRYADKKRIATHHDAAIL